MANEIILRDQNFVTVLAGITNDVSQDIRMLRVDPITGRLLVSSSGGSGVTSINTLTGAITLAAGTNITLGTVGNTITINSSGGGSGVTTLAAIGSSPNANGATIASTTLNLEPASASFGGVVTAGNQTFAGYKTFLHSSAGAVMAVQNSNASGFSGIEYLNNAGSTITFTGHYNVTNEFRVNNIGSGGIINFMIGSVSKVTVLNSGQLAASTGSTSLPGYTFLANNAIGFTTYNSAGADDGVRAVSNNLGAGFAVQNSNASGFSGIEYLNNAGSVQVFTGLQNSTNEFRFNNIGTGGTIVFKINSVDKLAVLNSGSTQFSGHALFNADNTYDIGASGATRPRNLYLAGVTATHMAFIGTGGLVSGSANNVWDGTTQKITNTSVGTGRADGLTLVNTTPATVGAQKNSPALRLSGRGWKTTATAASQDVDAFLYVEPIQGTTVADGRLGFYGGSNGSIGLRAFMNLLTGDFTINSGYLAAGRYNIPGTGFGSAGQRLTSGGAGSLTWTNDPSFSLTSGSGTTANGTAPDLGGTLTVNANLNTSTKTYRFGIDAQLRVSTVPNSQFDNNGSTGLGVLEITGSSGGYEITTTDITTLRINDADTFFGSVSPITIIDGSRGDLEGRIYSISVNKGQLGGNTYEITPTGCTIEDRNGDFGATLSLGASANHKVIIQNVLQEGTENYRWILLMYS